MGMSVRGDEKISVLRCSNMAPTSPQKKKSTKKQKVAAKGNKAAVIGNKTVRQWNQSTPATPSIGSDKDDAESVVAVDGDVVMDDVSEIDDEEELGKIPVM